MIEIIEKLADQVYSIIICLVEAVKFPFTPLSHFTPGKHILTSLNSIKIEVSIKTTNMVGMRWN